MKRRMGVLRVGLATVLVSAGLGGLPAQAFAVGPTLAPKLIFREIKITGDEFVVLANTGTADALLGTYWLGYINDDAAGVTAPPLEQLPNRVLAPGKALLLSGGGTIDVCDASVVAKLSPTLSDSKGTLTLWQQNGGNFTQLTDPQSQAHWGKSTKSTALPAGEIDLTLEKDQYSANPVWYFDTAAGWQVADFQNCTLKRYTVPVDTTGVQVANWPENDDQPPATIVSLASDDSVVAATGPTLPADDVGLKPPQLTELLPNPSGTGTDATDEFIELYNPNTVVFDLSGFVLQTGITTKHSYTFPAGATMAGKSFVAFYASTTGLSLSNTSGAADLLDPFGTVITQTDPYGAAKDGQAWALADGIWYWTNQPTPNAANVVNQAGSAAPVLSAKSKSSATSQSKSAVKGSSTNKTAPSFSTNSAASDTAQVTPIHPWTLAVVAVAAVAYGLYEYRLDVANHLYQFRKHRAARRSNR